MSEAQVVRMSMAVRRVCLRDGTKTMTGFLGECFMMAWYTGLAMDSKRVCVWLMLKPWEGQGQVTTMCQREGRRGDRQPNLAQSYLDVEL